MTKLRNRLLIIEDDARVSRYIIHVANRLGLICTATSKKGDIESAYRDAAPDMILLDPKPHEIVCEKVLRKLAGLHTDATIVLADTNPDDINKLEELGTSLGLHMDGVLPGVFDTELLREELTSAFKLAETVPL